MTTHAVDGLTFTFPPGWTVSRYDRWSCYRNQFSRIRDRIKAVDLVAVDPRGTAWFIEAKDYRGRPRSKPSDLGAEVQAKVLDTLAALLPAGVHANDVVERSHARKVLAATRLRVVLQLEQPAKASKLRPRAIDPAALFQTLRRLLKPVDAHPLVAEKHRMHSLAWTVS